MQKFWIRSPDGKILLPTPPQLEFLRSPACFRAFLGGVGAGKSTTGAYETARVLLERPGSTVLVGRWSYKELSHTSWDTLIRLLPRAVIRGVASSNTNMAVRLVNGSTALGWNLQNWLRLTSLNLDAAWIDEVTELPDAAPYMEVCRRLRGPMGPHRLWVTGTPAGLDWIWDLYVKENKPDHHYVHAPTRTNAAHLPVEYENRLRSVLSPEEKLRFLEAQFNAFGGQIFWNWDEDVHVVEPFPIPEHWPKYRGLDPGYAQDPAACILVTVDEDGNHYVIDEFYERGKLIREQAKEILRMSKGYRVEYTAYDPSANKRSDETGTTQIDVYRNHGIHPCRMGDSRADPMIEVVRDMLAVDAARLHPLSLRAGSPQLFVFKPCTWIRHEFAAWRWGKNNRPMEANDHALKALMYLISTRPAPAVSLEARTPNPQWGQFWEGVAEEATSEDVIGNERRAA